jgi:hypothetical protein
VACRAEQLQIVEILLAASAKHHLFVIDLQAFGLPAVRRLAASARPPPRRVTDGGRNVAAPAAMGAVSGKW